MKRILIAVVEELAELKDRVTQLEKDLLLEQDRNKDFHERLRVFERFLEDNDA